MIYTSYFVIIINYVNKIQNYFKLKVLAASASLPSRFESALRLNKI